MLCQLWNIISFLLVLVNRGSFALAFSRSSHRLFQSKIDDLGVDVDVGVRIRDCKYAELNPVSDLVLQSFYTNPQEVWKHMFRLAELNRLQQNFPYMDPDRHHMLVALLDEDDGTATSNAIVGFVDIDARPAKPNFHYKNNPRPMLSDLLTCPNHRRKGIARQLVKICETICKEDFKSEEIFIRVMVENEAAIQMYTTMGYEFIENPGDPENVRLLQKHL